MKLDCLEHPKTEKLADLLGVKLYSAWGLLEGLWALASQRAKTGALGKLGAAYIARKLRWDGDADALINAFVDAGFLERHTCCDEHAIIIHDWADHWPNHVRVHGDRLRKAGKPFHVGPCSNEIEPRAGLCAQHSNTDALSCDDVEMVVPSTETRTRTKTHTHTTPKPSPSTSPPKASPIPGKSTGGNGIGGGGVSSASGFGDSDSDRRKNESILLSQLRSALCFYDDEQIKRLMGDESTQARRDKTDLVENIVPGMILLEVPTDDWLREARDIAASVDPSERVKIFRARLKKAGFEIGKKGKPATTAA